MQIVVETIRDHAPVDINPSMFHNIFVCLNNLCLLHVENESWQKASSDGKEQDDAESTLVVFVVSRISVTCCRSVQLLGKSTRR